MIDNIEKLNFKIIEPNNSRRRTCPLINVNHNRITFNSETSRLLKLPESYEYVEVEESTEDIIGNNKYLLFRFLEYRTKHSFKLSKERSNRLAISSKSLVQEVFGDEWEEKSMRFDRVEIDNEKRLVLVAI